MNQRRSFASRRSNLKSLGSRPRNFRGRAKSSWVPCALSISSVRLPTACSVTSSPSRSPNASATAEGKRSAKLLPHFEIRMMRPMDINLGKSVSAVQRDTRACTFLEVQSPRRANQYDGKSAAAFGKYLIPKGSKQTNLAPRLV
jgi:hypothetical protein